MGIRPARARYKGFRSLTTAARSVHLPTLSANGTWNWSGFDARITSIQALYDYNSSFVRLQKAIGTVTEQKRIRNGARRTEHE